METLQGVADVRQQHGEQSRILRVEACGIDLPEALEEPVASGLPEFEALVQDRLPRWFRKDGSSRRILRDGAGLQAQGAQPLVSNKQQARGVG